jgi:membrane-associated protein
VGDLLHNLPQLIAAVGHLGVFAIIFAESGLLVGFFLPGDSLLFTAGLLASQGYLNLPLLLVGSFAAAVFGDSVGYAFGARVGPRLFSRQDSLLFHRAHLERARRFFDRYGPRAIVLARFLPVVRTFTPILAGVGQMRYRTFLTYNLVGGAVWAVGVPLLGYWLGNAVPDADRYLLPVVAAIVLSSVIPPAVELWRVRRRALHADRETL